MIIQSTSFAPVVILGVRCKICQLTKGPASFISVSDERGSICENCYRWHLDALKVFAGDPPRGCQACHKSFAQLAAMYPGENVPMDLVPVDGIYQIFCPPCGNDFVKKSPMYRETLYGKMKKLAGWK